MLDSSYYPWTMGDGVMFIRKLAEVVAPAGYGAGLIGSVLTKGRSMRDLDVVLFPTCIGKENNEGVMKALQEFGMTRKQDVLLVHKIWRKQGSQDTKYVDIWDYNGKRVDLFWLK
jgi:hypothetical protein